MPGFPATVRFRVPIVEIALNLTVALAGSVVAIWLLSRILPRTALYGALVSHSVSGESSVVIREKLQAKRLGVTGVTVSVLRPGGKARFGDDILDVISQGDMVPRNHRVRIIGYSGKEAIVEVA